MLKAFKPSHEFCSISLSIHLKPLVSDQSLQLRRRSDLVQDVLLLRSQRHVGGLVLELLDGLEVLRIRSQIRKSPDVSQRAVLFTKFVVRENAAVLF